MKGVYIDINCDLGEGIGNEKDLMPLISSCNIACGAHAGDPKTIREVVRIAKANGVKVGAHPSYPDRANFGRISMKLSELELIDSINSQVNSFISILKEEQVPMHHIKAHGALYNDIAKDARLAKVYLKALERYREDTNLYVPFGSEIEREGLKQGFKVIREAFADRSYNADLSLVSRNLPNAVLHEPKQVFDHLLHMIKKGSVQTVDGKSVAIAAETFCIHSDTAAVLQILNYLSRTLPEQHIFIRK
ncbi:MAG: 5-oxoprolinase subunit PxpA [Flavobacteriaceae bacterium]